MLWELLFLSYINSTRFSRLMSSLGHYIEKLPRRSGVGLFAGTFRLMAQQFSCAEPRPGRSAALPATEKAEITMC
ncbi:unnamed protein product [Boreogadus saida]